MNFGTTYHSSRELGEHRRLRRPEHLRRRRPRSAARRRRRDRVHGPRRRRTPARRTRCPPGVVAVTGVQVQVDRPAQRRPDRRPCTSSAGAARSIPSAGKDYVELPVPPRLGRLQDHLQVQPTDRTPRTRRSRRRTTSTTSPIGGRRTPSGSPRRARAASTSSTATRTSSHPANCGRSEDTFDDAEGAFIVNKDGPVRAIRSYIGANSGPNTQREHIFYDQREDVRTFLRVHAIPGIMDFFDYSPRGRATGMIYSNDKNPTGVTDRRCPRHARRREPRSGRRSTGRRARSPASARSRRTSRRRPPSGTTSTTRRRPRRSARATVRLRLERQPDHVGAPVHRSRDRVHRTPSSANRTMYFESPGRTAADAKLASDRTAKPFTTSSPRGQAPDR